MSRRVGFFAIAAVVCATLTLVAPADFRFVPIGTAGVYTVLALLTALERRGAERDRREP
jgi:hypothetical protein